MLLDVLLEQTVEVLFPIVVTSLFVCCDAVEHLKAAAEALHFGHAHLEVQCQSLVFCDVKRRQLDFEICKTCNGEVM